MTDSPLNYSDLEYDGNGATSRTPTARSGARRNYDVRQA